MGTVLTYLMLPLMAGLLAFAQALWGTAIKAGALNGNFPTILNNLITNWRIWVGVLLYVAATALYFFILSKLKFFSVQVAMTGISIIFSVTLAFLLFQERPNLINIVGIFVVFTGVILVLYKS